MVLLFYLVLLPPLLVTQQVVHNGSLPLHVLALLINLWLELHGLLPPLALLLLLLYVQPIVHRGSVLLLLLLQYLLTPLAQLRLEQTLFFVFFILYKFL